VQSLCLAYHEDETENCLDVYVPQEGTQVVGVEVHMELHMVLRMEKALAVAFQSSLVVEVVSSLEVAEEVEVLLEQVDDMVGMQRDMLVGSRRFLEEERALAVDRVEEHASRCQHCSCVSSREDRL